MGGRNWYVCLIGSAPHAPESMCPSTGDLSLRKHRLPAPANFMAQRQT